MYFSTPLLVLAVVFPLTGSPVSAQTPKPDVPPRPVNTASFFRTFFNSQKGNPKQKPEQTIYFLARPSPSSQKTSNQASESYHYDKDKNELTFFGGFSSPGTIAAQESKSVSVAIDSVRTNRSPREATNRAGEKELVYDVDATTYILSLNGLENFDARLFDRKTHRFTLRVPLDKDLTKKRAASYQVILGVHPYEHNQGSMYGSSPSSPDVLSYTYYFYLFLPAELTEVFLVDPVSKKILAHYAPSPKSTRR